MRRRVLLTMLLLPPLGAHAQGGGRTPLSAGTRALAGRVGTDDYAAVLDHPDVAKALRSMMGAQALDILRRNLQVRTPIAADGPWIVLQGLAPRQGGEEEAIVAVQTETGLVDAGLLTGRNLMHFTQSTEGAENAVVLAWYAQRRGAGRTEMQVRQKPPAPG